MLTLLGNASDSLGDFLGLVDGTDAIRYWDDSISNWSDITGATRDEDYTLKYISNGDLAEYTMLTVGMLDQLYGDANRDGVVSAGDYAAVQGLFGFVGKPGLIGDANLDGVVSAGDYASVQANFGNTAAGVEVGATPEPATLSLLAVGGIMLLRRKRK